MPPGENRGHTNDTVMRFGYHEDCLFLSWLVGRSVGRYVEQSLLLLTGGICDISG